VWRPSVPCSIDDGKGSDFIHLGNVEPVAGFPESGIGCTVALECVELGWINEFEPIIEISSNVPRGDNAKGARKAFGTFGSKGLRPISNSGSHQPKKCSEKSHPYRVGNRLNVHNLRRNRISGHYGLIAAASSRASMIWSNVIDG